MSSYFDIIDTTLPGLRLVQRKPVGDNRGYLERLYCADELRELILGKAIVQINHTVTVKCGTVRGMHFQHSPHAETKVVNCLRGKIFDVSVDVRRSSPTFLKWHGEVLSEANHRSLLIPEGFAHGFQALVDDCELLYLHTAAYHPAAEGALNAMDPCLAIAWPHEITEMSDRDRSHGMLTDRVGGVEP